MQESSQENPFLKILDAFRHQLEERAAHTTDTKEATAYSADIDAINRQINDLAKMEQEVQKRIEEKIKTHSLPKNHPLWENTKEVIEEINRHNPHQPITAPKVILALPKEEVVQLLGGAYTPAGYLYQGDVLLVDKDSAISKDILAHELTHKQQQLYDKMPDLSHFHNLAALNDWWMQYSTTKEIRADLGAAKISSSALYLPQQLAQIQSSNFKKILEPIWKDITTTNEMKSAIDGIIEGLTESFLNITEKEREELDQALQCGSISSVKDKVAEIMANSIGDPGHPSPEKRQFFIEKQVQSEILNKLVYDEDKVLAEWESEFNKKQEAEKIHPEKETQDLLGLNVEAKQEYPFPITFSDSPCATPPEHGLKTTASSQKPFKTPHI